VVLELAKHARLTLLLVAWLREQPMRADREVAATGN
jgi:hypothetical protein